MAEETFDGVVLRETPLGETGKRLVVLAKDLGKITVSAKGAKSAKSRLSAPSQMFTKCTDTKHKYSKYSQAAPNEN